MILKKIKIYYCFWFVSLLILVIGFLGKRFFGDTFDLNVGDTYYVIAHRYLTLLLSFCYFIIGIGYWFVQKVLKRKLVNYLTVIHCVILFGSFLIYWLVYFYSNGIQNKSFALFDNYELINKTLLILFLLIIFIGQPIYFVNLLVGIFRKQSAIR
jgi:heme/copper-type cytochrome/quinol oxidase subunit 1